MKHIRIRNNDVSAVRQLAGRWGGIAVVVKRANVAVPARSKFREGSPICGPAYWGALVGNR